MERRGGAEHHIRELEKARTSAEQLEVLLRRSEAEVKRSIGIDALERFAGEIATYFKGLLDEVSGCGRALQRGMDYRDPLRVHARSIVAHAEAGKRLAGRLLAFSEGGKVNPTVININHFVRDLAHLVSGLARKRIRLRTVLTSLDLTVMADPARLGQVFVSLIRHGSAFMSGGGTITVRTDLIPVANNLVAGRNAGGCALLSIESVQEADCAVKDLPVTKRQQKEIRLGFSLIRRIIQEHRGAFRIGGQRGKTIEYSIYLPVFASCAQP